MTNWQLPEQTPNPLFTVVQSKDVTPNLVFEWVDNEHIIIVRTKNDNASLADLEAWAEEMVKGSEIVDPRSMPCMLIIPPSNVLRVASHMRRAVQHITQKFPRLKTAIALIVPDSILTEIMKVTAQMVMLAQPHINVRFFADQESGLLWLHQSLERHTSQLV